jgi:hypothetical protein
MYKSSFGSVVACLALLWPAALGAQEASQAGLAIDHKSVGCIVAGKYPKMNACFEPNSQVANGRTYFRAEGGTSWYYVVNKPDAPCWSGVLPKPRKELIDKHVDYYVQVTGKDLQESRTAEFHPLVVAKEADCKDKPVGLYLNKADVSVFPSLPPEFAAGGVSTGVLVGAGVAVAGATAGGIAAASGGDDNTTTTFPVTTPTTTPVTTTTTSSTTMTPAQPGVFRFNFNVSPKNGTEPLDVLVDMCASSPVGSLRYFYDFDGDGSFDFQGPGPGNCQQTRAFTLQGFGPAGGPPPSTQKPKMRVFDVMGCAEPRVEDLQPQTRLCQTAQVTIDENQGLRVNAIRLNREGAAARRLAWSTQLDVPNANGQVVVNGATAVFSGPGRSNAVAVGRRGENRIEAQLVQAGGKPGTWRFELAATSSLEPGSIRVVAGDVALVTGDAIVFQLKGTPGERVVFTFLTGR